MKQELRDAVIGEYLKGLKLPSIARHYVERARQAQEGSWPYEDYLKELLEGEVLQRQQHRAERLLKLAQFPDIKLLDEIDWEVMSGIDLVTLAAMLGHSRIQMVLRYAHLTDQHQTEAAKRLEEFNTAMAIAEVEQRQAATTLQEPTTVSTTMVN